MSGGDSSAWTDEDIATLRLLWDAGMSASKIADRLRTTPNAVIGKRKRLGLPERGNPAAAKITDETIAEWVKLRGRGLTCEAIAARSGVYHGTVAAKLRALGVTAPPSAESAAPVESKPPPGDTAPIGGARLIPERPDLRPGRPAEPDPPPPEPTALRQSDGCMWPLWDHDGRPTHRYCGAWRATRRDVHGNRVRGPYCERHAAIAYGRWPRRDAG